MLAATHAAAGHSVAVMAVTVETRELELTLYDVALSAAVMVVPPAMPVPAILVPTARTGGVPVVKVRMLPETLAPVQGLVLHTVPEKPVTTVATGPRNVEVIAPGNGVEGE